MTPFITELDNGLRVLLLESHSAPVASFWVWYGVGSRNEIPGWTGISHWVEHMLFKGTPTHPKGVLTRAIERLGGRWNAFTSWDVTAYHEVLPAEHLPFAIGLEADRMRHTLFEPEEVESERTVIISEREGAENFPTSHLSEEVNALAFKVHSYRYPVIGWKSDLRRMTRDDLYRHYRTYYHPRNALVVAVGAFDTPQVLPQIRQAFGEIDSGPEIPPVLPEEPPQELARVKRQAKAQFVYARDGVHGLGYMVGFYAMVDRPDAFFTLQDRLEQVTAADVQRAAAATVTPRQRTGGWYLPQEGAQSAAAAAAVPPVGHRMA